MARHDAAVVSRSISRPRPGSHRLRKSSSLEGEVVHGQPGSRGDRFQATLRELDHHVDLQDLPLVMKGQGLEVGVGKAPPFLLQPDGHGWPEYRQPLVELDDLQLVQPQQRAVQQLGGVPDFALDHPGRIPSHG